MGLLFPFLMQINFNILNWMCKEAPQIRKTHLVVGKKTPSETGINRKELRDLHISPSPEPDLTPGPSRAPIQIPSGFLGSALAASSRSENKL